MAKKAVLLKSKEWKNREEMATFLRELADRMAEGEVVIKQGADDVVLTLPDSMRLKVKAKRKTKKRGKKFGFNIKVKWLEGDKGRAGITLG